MKGSRALEVQGTPRQSWAFTRSGEAGLSLGFQMADSQCLGTGHRAPAAKQMHQARASTAPHPGWIYAQRACRMGRAPVPKAAQSEDHLWRQSSGGPGHG